MKELAIKCGTRQEILDYFKNKVDSRGTLPTAYHSRDAADIGTFWEIDYAPIVKQVDDAIANGMPIVSVRIVEMYEKSHEDGTVYAQGTDHREQFIIEDYGDIRLNMEMDRLDNPELRKRRIDAIKIVMNMDIDAEDRWNRILKIVDEFNGVSIPFKPNTIV